MNVNKNNPLTSIIILTHNGLRYTRRCINSILTHTKANYELIIVDNASTDRTVKYLQSVQNVRVIANQHNKGFSGGCNQGLRIASGEYIVLLNNDTVVTEGWLSRLIAWLESNKQIGIVGPRSNFVLPLQAIPKAPYKSMKKMHDFAAQWVKGHKNQGFSVDYLSGFCMAFRKELIQHIGGLDERFNPGYFEDTDFCLRTSIAGKKLWVANDVYIHHYGSSSFKTNRKVHGTAIAESQKKFFNKWKINNFNQIKDLVKREQPFNPERHYVPF
ncbi:glycosyltransferase family 2 protein [Bacillus sp. ISL-47]|uniref:glycosyltransferase family 2 protein n=1 Tax=Bacillus sp. ISL-47 TaxID=2819130 RepID=UPI001BEB5909|nr:glycosyltransferase family 2 protein [Pseudomonas sp. ISL-84]